MNSIVKALHEKMVQAGKDGQWKLEELCKMAALEIETKSAHNAAMEDDAVHNTATIKMLMAQLAEQVEENRGMRIQLGWSPK